MLTAAVKNNKGQSILEVVFVLPTLFLFVGILFRLNMSVQAAINNTQYARSQIYVLTANSSDYPRLQFTQYSDALLPTKMFGAAGQDMMILGVADITALADPDGAGLQPIPQSQQIGRTKSIKGSTIYLRNASAICTQINKVPTGTSARWPFGGSACNYTGLDGG